MAEHGGYRKPAHPAPTSGPGALSKRTDGGPADRQAMRDLPNAQYGERADLRAVQGGAPLAGQPVADPRAGIVPLNAPTQRPDEPVTAGSPVGPGVGPAAAGIETRSPDQQDAQSLARILPLLEFAANLPDANPSSRTLVRQIRAYL